MGFLTKATQEHVKKMTENVSVFREQLEAFAVKHKKDINKDPVLRKRFHEMCSSIGVDPLASQKVSCLSLDCRRL